MKQSKSSGAKELFPGSDIIRKYTFKTISTRDSSALLAKANHIMINVFTVSREKSAHFSISDCFECRTPYKTAA
jgi:hypothetical protein